MKEFYPTPKDVGIQLLSPFEKHQLGLVLEPSAGMGDLADVVTDNGRPYSSYSDQWAQIQDIYCLDINPQFQAVLQNKGYKVVGSDFLQYDADMLFDTIIMNPPFSNGAEHLLRAWSLIKDTGGRIGCILNAETIRNPHTAKRQQVVSLLDKHSFHPQKFVTNGFKKADRPTNVEIALVWLEAKIDPSQFDFGVIGLKTEAAEVLKEYSANPIASTNLLESLVNQYKAAKDLIVKMHHANSKLRFYLREIPQVTDTLKYVTTNESLINLKQRFWKYVFDTAKLGARTTSKFQKRFHAYIKQTQSLAFTVENIRSVLDMFFLNKGKILQECIVEVFDEACGYHEKNKIHWEGWKTNKSWKLNKRIIHPYGIRYDKTYHSPWGMNYHNNSFFHDLDIVCGWLSGRDYFTTIDQALSHQIDQLNRLPNARTSKNYMQPFESTFFKIRIYKKGTIHLDFRDPDLLNKFNIVAAKGKNWVGPGY